jgi:Family of unknown function (DUF6459)
MTAASPVVAAAPGRTRSIRSVVTTGGIRLRPAPPLEPPFDDEADRCGMPGASVADGQLALDLLHDPPPLETGADPRRGEPRPTPAPRPIGTGIVGTPPEHRIATKRFLGVCLEILNGYRPPAQLRSFCTPAEAGGVIERVAARTALVACGATTAPRHQSGGVFRAGPTPGSGTASRPGVGRRPPSPPNRVRLRRLHVCEPLPGIAEAAVVLETGDRCWAMAFRLERNRGNWLCTAIAMP